MKTISNILRTAAATIMGEHFKTTDEMLEWALKHQGEKDPPAPDVEVKEDTTDSEVPETFGRVWADGSKVRAASMDFHEEWRKVVDEHRKAQDRDFEALLEKAVPYLRSVGYDLDVKRSYLEVEQRGSDGPRLAGMLMLTEREENNVRHDDPKNASKVAEWVSQALGVGGRARHMGSFSWAVDLGE